MMTRYLERCIRQFKNKTVLIAGLVSYCLIWIFVASLTFLLINLSAGLFTNGPRDLPKSGLYSLMGLLLYGPAMPLIICLGYWHLHTLELFIFKKSSRCHRDQWVQESVNIGLRLGFFEMLISAFIGGSSAEFWWTNILDFGIPAFIASVVAGYTLGHFYFYIIRFLSP